MEVQFFISAFVTLFVVMDPIGLAPIFLALTPGMSPAQRRAIALRASLIAGGLLTLFAFLGEGVLEFLGISMAAFRISGGILLLITALDMLFERRTQRRKDQSEESMEIDHDPSVFPLALPLIAGPGSIAAMILLAGQTQATGSALASVLTALGAMLSVLIITFVLFLAAPLLERVLRETGIKVLTRVLGMLLAALAVQFMLDGLREFGFLG